MDGPLGGAVGLIENKTYNTTTHLELSLALVIIANYCSFPSFSFGQALGKLKGKVLTHSKKVGWWKSLMVECVSIF